MRVLFAGSPEIAVPALLAAGEVCTLVGVLTNPPAPQGRSLVPRPTAVALAAAQAFPGLPLLAPERLGPAERAAVAALRPDVLAVFAYGRLFGPRFRALFPAGGFNVHPSLLPRWRGPAPLPWAILAGDPETGVSVQRVAPRMDTGDILAVARRPLSGHETTASLGVWAAEAGAVLLAEVLRALAGGSLGPGQAQTEARATYSAQIAKDDGRLDWALPAVRLDAQVRAYDPWPGTWTGLGGDRLGILAAKACADTGAGTGADGAAAPVPGQVIDIDKSRGIMVQTGAGLLAVSVLQARGRRPLGFKDFANGVRGLLGARLGWP